jgi:hypothetical protein
LIVGLVLQEVNSLIGKRESSEQESLNRVAEVPVLSLLAVFVHYIAHNTKVDVCICLLLSLDDELVSLVISVRETNHHHAMNDLLLLERSSLSEDVLTQNVVDELLHHHIHVGFTGSGKATFFEVLLPLLEV